MTRYLTWFSCIVWLLPVAAAADLAPAKGRLLVATEEVHGEIFAETVILLLAYDESGAMGLVVNRPTEVSLEELLEETKAVAGDRTTVYWGGPVEMDSLSALAKSGASAEAAEQVVTSVYRVPFDTAMEKAAAEPASARFYLGYAGWAPGQLDHELARGSWHVLPASSDIVFADDPKRLWDRLRPIEEYVAAARAR